MKSKKESLKELQQIPGIGPSIAQDLLDLGMHTIADL
ncbi:MAG: pathogenicity locus, partial [Candidatus Heimdallarchaeota archaeon]|nr:pathogenicity locus [Candidatus Heimdallarchaeota archaeon]